MTERPHRFFSFLLLFPCSSLPLFLFSRADHVPNIRASARIVHPCLFLLSPFLFYSFILSLPGLRLRRRWLEGRVSLLAFVICRFFLWRALLLPRPFFAVLCSPRLVFLSACTPCSRSGRASARLRPCSTPPHLPASLHLPTPFLLPPPPTFPQLFIPLFIASSCVVASLAPQAPIFRHVMVFGVGRAARFGLRSSFLLAPTSTVSSPCTGEAPILLAHSLAASEPKLVPFRRSP